LKKIGFGTYRITEHNPEHLDALKTAILEGIELIDTSSNYMNGEAERAIAKVLATLPATKIAHLKIISKAGYIQGDLLEEIKRDKKYNSLKYKEIVEFNENLFHSIEPQFLHDELSKSLDRLNLSQIDAYLLHNPEYYLLDALNNGIEKEKALETMYERIYRAFVALEKEVKNGRIASYGISSNSFAQKEDALDFLPYKKLTAIAKDAAKSIGSETCHFNTLELPINLLEREGLKAAKWAKKNNLRVLSNRALNASLNNQIIRLAEYKEPAEYHTTLNVLVDFCEEVQIRDVANLLQNLDEKVHTYATFAEYENFLFTQVIPFVQKALASYDATEQYTIAEQINQFLMLYAQMVHHELGKKTRTALIEAGVLKQNNATLQQSALQFLLQEKDIDYILVGMRKITYVNEVSQINS